MPQIKLGVGLVLSATLRGLGFVVGLLLPILLASPGVADVEHSAAAAPAGSSYISTQIIPVTIWHRAELFLSWVLLGSCQDALSFEIQGSVDGPALF